MKRKQHDHYSFIIWKDAQATSLRWCIVSTELKFILLSNNSMVTLFVLGIFK